MDYEPGRGLKESITNSCGSTGGGGGGLRPPCLLAAFLPVFTGLFRHLPPPARYAAVREAGRMINSLFYFPYFRLT